MDEGAVKAWLRDHHGVSRETEALLDRYVAMLLQESEQQNLISRSTVPILWDRHIRDSAQLLSFAGGKEKAGKWLDLGSGPGLPGIVLALIADLDITLVESRARRIAFLEEVRTALELQNRVTIEGRRLENVETRQFSAITARAFAPLPKLFSLAERFAVPETLWILPKGKSVNTELEAAAQQWHYESQLVRSLTDDQSAILLARKVRPRRRK